MLDRPAGWIKKERARPTGRRSRMIPAPFAYHRPRSLDETLGLLAHHGEDARVVAGGHSLIPMMKLRLARPEHPVDLQDLKELRGIQTNPDTVIIGAMTTQHELIGSETLTARCPIIRETALQIADPQVRYCGTLGGNIANGDPGNDMPAVMMALDARYRLAGERNARSQHASFTDGSIRRRSSQTRFWRRSASRCRPQVTDTLTRSKSARSATTRRPQPR